VTELDVSHNKLGDRGHALLARLLDGNGTIVALAHGHQRPDMHHGELTVGARVEARFGGAHGRHVGDGAVLIGYYPGTVTRAYRPGSLLPPGTHDAEIAKHIAGGENRESVLDILRQRTHAHPDGGSYDVLYDDGDDEKAVPRPLVRLVYTAPRALLDAIERRLARNRGRCPLGMASGAIADGALALSASGWLPFGGRGGSTERVAHAPFHPGRMDPQNPRAFTEWVHPNGSHRNNCVFVGGCGDARRHWIEVDLGRVRTLTGVALQVRPSTRDSVLAAAVLVYLLASLPNNFSHSLSSPSTCYDYIDYGRGAAGARRRQELGGELQAAVQARQGAALPLPHGEGAARGGPHLPRQQRRAVRRRRARREQGGQARWGRRRRRRWRRRRRRREQPSAADDN
jgi:hypothetical protein